MRENMDYKERLERTKELYPTANADQRYVLECLFPELKETEDEKIRKAIVEFFVLQDDNTTYSFVPKEQILAWLEKQSEQNKIEALRTEYEKGRADVIAEMKSSWS